MENYFQQAQSPEYIAGGESPATYVQESSVSDCESIVTGSSSSSSSSSHRHGRGIFREGLVVELSESERAYEVIRHKFVSSLSSIGEKTTTVVSIHRKNWSGFSAQARLQSFQIHSRAMENKHGGGSANVKFAWYGCERERIEQIISHGFSHREIQDNNNGAIVLSPVDFPIESVEGSVASNDGLKHVLLCRVLLGRSELVLPGSSQTHPSSDEFDSGVDRIENPKKYMIWSADMNTRILPEYVVTFRSPAVSSLRESLRMDWMKKPTSPWISFPTLISALRKFLPPNAISLINKSHRDYKERRISRTELIHKVRQLTGDKLLISVIKSYRGTKELKKPLLSSNSNTIKE